MLSDGASLRPYTSDALVTPVENYQKGTVALQRFFGGYVEDGDLKGKKNAKYLSTLQEITDGKESTLFVDVDDVENFFQKDTTEAAVQALCETAKTNSNRFRTMIFEAAEEVRKSKTIKSKDVPHSAQDAAYERAKVPVHLRAPFDVRLRAPRKAPPLVLREIRAQHIGCLLRMAGLVTRVSAVKPRLQVACYKCTDCGAEAFQHVEGQTYMPLSNCGSDSCTKNRRKGDLKLLLRQCRFTKYQEATVQEPPKDVPQGSVPRSVKLIVTGDLTRILTPGMSVTVGGIPQPVVKVGFAAMKGGLVARTYFDVQEIEIHKQSYTEMLNISDPVLQAKVEALRRDPDLYSRMAYSIGPEIHGMNDVKRILLLQLIGGVNETFPDGMKIRGDLHILLMGDPGVAKSQLLGQICKLAPRAHFATGKGSSGVGLTASVSKDPVTGEFALEGGAIVLSDNGICCIDEFDKMDERDRTAIHEVMEQQTVSIAKAGIAATLNARTSILAAANPVYGRYDVTKSPVLNMGLPAALLSRFDIQFLLLDSVDHAKDLQLAKHVLQVHKNLKPPQDASSLEVIEPEVMRLLVANAKSINPKISGSLRQTIVEQYVEMRKMEHYQNIPEVLRSYTTPRTLFGLLRMSQALARLRGSEVVEMVDFEESLRLIAESKRSVQVATDDSKKTGKRTNFRDDIMDILREIESRSKDKNSPWLKMTDVESYVERQGFSQSQLLATVAEYVELGVLLWRDHRKLEVAFMESVE